MEKIFMHILKSLMHDENHTHAIAYDSEEKTNNLMRLNNCDQIEGVFLLDLIKSSLINP